MLPQWHLDIISTKPQPLPIIALSQTPTNGRIRSGQHHGDVTVQLRPLRLGYGAVMVLTAMIRLRSGVQKPWKTYGIFKHAEKICDALWGLTVQLQTPKMAHRSPAVTAPLSKSV